MVKKFTKSQFSAVSNELVKLAKEFVSKGFDSSISFTKTNVTIFIHDNNVCACMLTIFEDRFVNKREVKELLDIAKRADVALNGKYTKLMLEGYENKKYTDDFHFEF